VKSCNWDSCWKNEWSLTILEGLNKTILNNDSFVITRDLYWNLIFKIIIFSWCLNSYCSLAHIFLVYCHKSLLPNFSRLEWWKLTFPIPIILSISKNNSTLYLIKMKLLQELVDRFSSVNHPKLKFTNNYSSCSILLHYIHGFRDSRTTVDVWITDCTCVAQIVYCFEFCPCLSYKQGYNRWSWIFSEVLPLFGWERRYSFNSLYLRTLLPTWPAVV